MTDEEFWAVEEGLWTRGRAHYERWLSPDCLLALPPPTGIMVGDGFVAHLPAEGGWKSVEMDGRALARPAPGIVVLAYRGVGRRDGESRSALCTSAYAANGDGWRLVQHQQTTVE